MSKLLNKLMQLVLFSTLAVFAAEEPEVITLAETIGKVKIVDGVAVRDTSGSYPSTWAYQAPYWPNGLAPVSGKHYTIAPNITLRLPMTTKTEEVFPGESLTVQGRTGSKNGGTIAATGPKTPGFSSFKKLVFEHDAYLKNWTQNARQNNQQVRLHGDIQIDGKLAIMTDANLGCATLLTGTLKADAANIVVKGPTSWTSGLLDSQWKLFHLSFDADMTDFSGSLNLQSNAIFTVGTATGLDVTVDKGGVLRAKTATDMQVKSLTLNSDAQISVDMDPTNRKNGQIKVDGALSVSGPIKVYMLTNDFPYTTSAAPMPTNLPILVCSADQSLRLEDFVFIGALPDTAAFNEAVPFNASATLCLVEDVQAGTKALCLDIRPKIRLIASQSGTNYWNTRQEDYEDGRIPHEDADYFTSGYSLRGETGSELRYPMHSLTINGRNTSGSALAGGSCQIRSASVEFPNEGLILEMGTLYNYLGSRTLANRGTIPILGKTQVVQNIKNSAFVFDPANNAFTGFRFLTSFSGDAGATISLKGSYNSTDNHLSFAQYEFPSNTTAYCGAFEVQTNAVLAIGKDGFPHARSILVKGGTLPNAAGAVATLTPSNDCTVSNLTFEDRGAIEFRVDPRTGASGCITVTESLSLPTGGNGKVQVYFSAFPPATIAGTVSKGFPILTLKNGASGTLSAESFEFGEGTGTITALIDQTGAQRLNGSFEVRPNEAGDLTLYFVPEIGLVILFR